MTTPTSSDEAARRGRARSAPGAAFHRAWHRRRGATGGRGRPRRRARRSRAARTAAYVRPTCVSTRPRPPKRYRTWTSTNARKSRFRAPSATASSVAPMRGASRAHREHTLTLLRREQVAQEAGGDPRDRHREGNMLPPGVRQSGHGRGRGDSGRRRRRRRTDRRTGRAAARRARSRVRRLRTAGRARSARSGATARPAA